MKTLRVPAEGEVTFYARFGDVFTGMLALWLLIAMALHYRSSS
jgi:hypothetical protein